MRGIHHTVSQSGLLARGNQVCNDGRFWEGGPKTFGRVTGHLT